MPITLDSIKSKMVGKTFGKLTIVSYLGRNERGDNIWKAKCKCGDTVVGRTAIVDKQNSGCSLCKRSSGPQAEERRVYLLGKVFGRLTVTDFAGTTKHQAGLWKCSCICGNEIITKSSSLMSGATQSCGCYAREKAAKANTTHGLYNHPLYQVWWSMKDRCYNPKNLSFHRYGDRGVRICENWLHSFMNFYNWAVSKGYQEGLTIEREDNDGDYEPGNCRWATNNEQMQNTSLTKLSSDKVKLIRADPRTNHLIAEEYGVNESTISRIKAKFTWSNIN